MLMSNSVVTWPVLLLVQANFLVQIHCVSFVVIVNVMTLTTVTNVSMFCVKKVLNRVEPSFWKAVKVQV